MQNIIHLLVWIWTILQGKEISKENIINVYYARCLSMQDTYLNQEGTRDNSNVGA